MNSNKLETIERYGNKVHEVVSLMKSENLYRSRSFREITKNLIDAVKMQKENAYAEKKGKTIPFPSSNFDRLANDIERAIEPVIKKLENQNIVPPDARTGWKKRKCVKADRKCHNCGKRIKRKNDRLREPDYTYYQLGTSGKIICTNCYMSGVE